MTILDRPPLKGTPEEILRYLFRVIDQIQENFDQIEREKEE